MSFHEILSNLIILSFCVIEKKVELHDISASPVSRNPVLEMLGTVLKRAFVTTPDVPVKQGILFVKTRASTEAIIKWIEETDDMKFLIPGQLIGCGGSGGKCRQKNGSRDRNPGRAGLVSLSISIFPLPVNHL